MTLYTINLVFLRQVAMFNRSLSWNLLCFPEEEPQCVQYLVEGVTTTDYMEGENARIQCEATYAGNWAPTMDWSDRGDEQDASVGNDIKYYFDMMALKPEDDGKSFTCTTSFGDRNPPVGDGEHDDAAPSNTFTCSTQLIVYCESLSLYLMSLVTFLFDFQRFPSRLKEL